MHGPIVRLSLSDCHFPPEADFVMIYDWNPKKRLILGKSSEFITLKAWTKCRQSRGCAPSWWASYSQAKPTYSPPRFFTTILKLLEPVKLSILADLTCMSGRTSVRSAPCARSFAAAQFALRFNRLFRRSSRNRATSLQFDSHDILLTSHQPFLPVVLRSPESFASFQLDAKNS
jgi:hypothetical protein